jgi:hypothetical protein
VSFQRTLRIPDDGRTHPLPPGLGRFPIRRVADFADRVPAAWHERGGVFLPMYQREAMWLSFSGAHWRPNALKVGVGKVNALSGKPWDEALAAQRRRGGGQDYMVVPEQPWLDGINAGTGFIKQFVAMPLGLGHTVEGQITGKEEHGGVQLCVYEPKPGRFPDEPPRAAVLRGRSGAVGAAPAAAACVPASPAGKEMGLGAGGRMKQSIYPDRHGIEAWDSDNRARVFVHLVNSLAWTQITGEPMPSTPVDVNAYIAHGYPWYELYDEHLGDIDASEALAQVKSVGELDAVADGSW